MFFKFVMLAVAFVIVLFIFDAILPKLRITYKLYKELMEKKKQEKFKNKIKELEIK